RRYAPRCSRRWLSIRRCERQSAIASSPLLRAYQPINDQLPVLLEDPKSSLEGLQHLPGPRGLLASLLCFPEIAPQVVAVQLDEVEGVEEYALVSALVTDEIERGHAVVIVGDSFAVDDAGARAQACQRLDD